MAEFERSLIRRADPRRPEECEGEGKLLGRPRVIVDRATIDALRTEGLSWAKIATKLGVGEGTVYRMARSSAKIPSISAPVSRCEHAAD